MSTGLLVLAFAASAQAPLAPDAAPLALLTHPDYQTREWATRELAARCSAGVYPPACRAVVHVMTTSPSPEVRSRCNRVLGQSWGRRSVLAYALLDHATEGRYVLLDSLWYDPVLDRYDTGTEAGQAYGNPEVFSGDEYAGPTDGYTWQRRGSRRYGATRLLNGVPLAAVLTEYAAMNRNDGLYFARRQMDWPNITDPGPYALALFRWDVDPARPVTTQYEPEGGPGVIPFPLPFPLPLPAR